MNYYHYLRATCHDYIGEWLLEGLNKAVRKAQAKADSSNEGKERVTDETLEIADQRLGHQTPPLNVMYFQWFLLPHRQKDYLE